MKLLLISEDVQQLQIELSKHRELHDRINSQAKTFEDIVALLGAELDVVLHGYYDEEAVNKLCRIFVQKLQDKRKVIITDPGKVIDLMPNAKQLPHF